MIWYDAGMEKIGEFSGSREATAWAILLTARGIAWLASTRFLPGTWWPVLGQIEAMCRESACRLNEVGED